MKQLTQTMRLDGQCRRFIQTFDGGIRRVVRDYYGESWSSYLIIPRAALIEGIHRKRANGAQYHDCQWWNLIPGIDRWVRPAGYGGPGRPFAHQPMIWRDKSRRFVVVSQSGGLDV